MGGITAQPAHGLRFPANLRHTVDHAPFIVHESLLPGQHLREFLLGAGLVEGLPSQLRRGANLAVGGKAGIGGIAGSGGVFCAAAQRQEQEAQQAQVKFPLYGTMFHIDFSFR